MKAEELRINNIIYLTKDNFQSVKEYTLTGFDIYKLEDNDCADIKPIPLTEEWLLKFDFKFKDKGYPDLSVSYGLATESIHFVIGNYYHKLNFVHQLQNLYFALTGEELTIKTK